MKKGGGLIIRHGRIIRILRYNITVERDRIRVAAFVLIRAPLKKIIPWRALVIRAEKNAYTWTAPKLGCA